MARVSRKRQTPSAPVLDTSIRLWKTAVYVRLSVEDNGKDSDSIENQTAMIENYIASRAYLKKVAVFVDNGYTGTNFLRPEFHRMMEAVQAGLIDCVVVKDLSRLGRNYIEASQFIEKVCPFFDLRFIAINDGFDTATATSESQLSTAISNIINDYYAKDISRKVTSALNAKMERGDYIGNYAPYGYLKDPKNKNHLVVDPETSPIVTRIYLWRAEGMSYMGICKKLNDAGILSPSQLKRERGIETNFNQKARTILWNKHMITEILQSIIYIGHLAQKKGSQCLYGGIPYHVTSEDEWIVAKHTHEPIISEELYERVQKVNHAAAEKAKAAAGKYSNLPKAVNIYGKKFTCADCGSVMKLHRSFSRNRDKAYFTFKCPTYAEHGARGCSDIKIRKADLDDAVFAFIKSQMDVFLDMEKALQALLTAKKAKQNRSGTAREIRALRQKLAHKQSLLKDMYVDVKQGLLSETDYCYHKQIVLADIQAMELQISELELEKSEVQNMATGEMKWKQLIRKFYDATEISTEMADAFIESMKLQEDGTLEIKLSYMDEFAALTQSCEKIRKEVA